MDYFKQKYNQDKKIVLNTIKYPKQLYKLNNKLPEAKYDDEYINQKQIPIQKYYISPHQILPKIKNNKEKDKLKNKNYDIKQNEENKNEINDDKINKKKKVFKNYLNMKNKDLVMKTLKMKINNNHPFNYKGEIDIIIEE